MTVKRRLYALIYLEVCVHVHDSLFTNLIQFIIFQKHKGTEGVIQIENPNLVKAKNIKAKEADVSVLQPEVSVTLLLVAKYHKIPCHTLVIVQSFLVFSSIAFAMLLYKWRCHTLYEL